MAVPKKRTSKTKTRIRRTVWKKKAEKQAMKALSIRVSFNSISSENKQTKSSENKGFEN